VTSTPDHDSAPEFQAVEEIDYHDLDSPEHVSRSPQRSIILNPISGTEGATSSSTITGDDDEDQISEGNKTSPAMQKSYGATTNGLSTGYVGASSVRPHWNSLYGQDVPWLELDGEALSHLDTAKEAHDTRQEVNRTLQKQSAVALAIWKLWYGGVLDDFEDYQTRGLDMPAPTFIELDLKVWLRLYPWTGETVFYCDLPPFPKLDDPRPTWKEYARYGHAIALMKSGSMPVHATADNNPFGRRLTAAMLLAREGSRGLRRCFESILASFHLELERQYDHLEKPCERFVKQFSLRLSETEERNIAGHSDQTKAAAILAMVCHNKLVNGDLHSTLDDLHTQCQQSAEFSTKRAFVWAARLMLYYASPELENSPLPTHLCTRAVDGCKRISKMIHYHPHQELERLKGRGDGKGPMPEEWQDANFASLWTEWICCDSDFFLYDPLA
jgi:hypothetical protein